MPAPSRQDVHINRPLTNIAIAYRNDGFVGADYLFPVIPVQKQSDLYFIFQKGAWFRDVVAKRAPGTRAKEVDYFLSTGSYLCEEYALSDVIPDEVRENADNPLRPDREAVELVTDLLQLSQEVRIANLVTTAANWSSSATPTTKWDQASSDPLGDVETGIETIVSLIAREPNKAVMGRQVWTHLKNHQDLLDRIKYTERGIITVPMLQGLFGIPSIKVGNALKNTAQEGQADNLQFVWGKHFLMVWSPQRGGLRIPSAGYVFQWKNFQTLRFRRREEFSDVVTVRHSVDERVTAPDAGYLLTNVVS